MDNSMNSMKNKELYSKAYRRRKRLGIIDPTNIIAFMQDEIDFYRRRIDSLEADLTKKTKDKETCSHMGISGTKIKLNGCIDCEEQPKKKIYKGFKIIEIPEGIKIIGIERREHENL